MIFEKWILSAPYSEENTVCFYFTNVTHNVDIRVISVTPASVFYLHSVCEREFQKRALHHRLASGWSPSGVGAGSSVSDTGVGCKHRVVTEESCLSHRGLDSYTSFRKRL